MKILIATNTLTAIAQPVHATMCQFWFRLGRTFPEHDFMTFTPRRMSIDNMRNATAKTALEQNCDYVMFVDDDVLIDPLNTFASLLNACEHHGADIVMAQTYIRGYPFEPMFFKHENERLKPFRDYKKFVSKKTGLLKVDAVGFSCVMIKCSLIKKVTTPYFITGPKGTEDIYFCMKAKQELGAENVKVMVDTKVPTGHLLDPEPIHVNNREALLKFYDTTCPELKDRRNKDRGTSYAKQVEKTLASKEANLKSRVRRK